MSSGNGSETALLANTSTLLEGPGPFPANMTAFLKIDECQICHRSLPWEWAAAVLLNGKQLAGTGVWCSQLTDGVCPNCRASLDAQRRKEEQAIALRKDLVQSSGL